MFWQKHLTVTLETAHAYTTWNSYRSGQSQRSGNRGKSAPRKLRTYRPILQHTRTFIIIITCVFNHGIIWFRNLQLLLTLNHWRLTAISESSVVSFQTNDVESRTCRSGSLPQFGLDLYFRFSLLCFVPALFTFSITSETVVCFWCIRSVLKVLITFTVQEGEQIHTRYLMDALR